MAERRPISKGEAPRERAKRVKAAPVPVMFQTLPKIQPRVVTTSAPRRAWPATGWARVTVRGSGSVARASLRAHEAALALSGGRRRGVADIFGLLGAWWSSGARTGAPSGR